ncbi:hypothetical protein ACTFIU_011147 [Dictyostelium citrinum]
MEQLVKLGFMLNLEKSVIKEIRNFLKLDSCSPRKLAGLKRKLIALKDAVIPFRLYTGKTNKFHCRCLSLSNGDWDQSFVIPQDVKSEISNWLTLLMEWQRDKSISKLRLCSYNRCFRISIIETFVELDELIFSSTEGKSIYYESWITKVSTVSLDFHRPIFLTTWKGTLLDSSRDAKSERVECDLNLETSIPDFEEGIDPGFDHEGFYNGVEVSNRVFNDSNSSSSSSSSSILGTFQEVLTKESI